MITTISQDYFETQWRYYCETFFKENASQMFISISLSQHNENGIFKM